MITSWIGKWVSVTATHRVIEQEALTGRLRAFNDEYVTLEVLETVVLIMRKHIVAMALPTNQDHITVEAMNLTKVKENQF